MLTRMARLLTRMARMLTRMTRWLAYYTYSPPSRTLHSDSVLYIQTFTNNI